MPTKVYTANQIIKYAGITGYEILRIGKIEQFKAEELGDPEIKRLEEFFAYAEEYLRARSEYLYNLFKAREKLIRIYTEIVKALLNGPTFGGLEPDQGEFGIQLIFPQLLKYATTTPVAWANNSWNVTVADTEVGTTKYIFGNATTYYRGNNTEGSRTLYLIFKNGIFTVGDKPFFSQYKMEFEGKPYNVFKTTPFGDLPHRETKDELIYPIDFPFDIFIPYNYGYKLAVLPERSGTFDLRVLGVVWYEYDAFKDLVWVT